MLFSKLFKIMVKIVTFGVLGGNRPNRLPCINPCIKTYNEYAAHLCVPLFSAKYFMGIDFVI